MYQAAFALGPRVVLDEGVVQDANLSLQRFTWPVPNDLIFLRGGIETQSIDGDAVPPARQRQAFPALAVSRKGERGWKVEGGVDLKQRVHEPGHEVGGRFRLGAVGGVARPLEEPTHVQLVHVRPAGGQGVGGLVSVSVLCCKKDKEKL